MTDPNLLTFAKAILADFPYLGDIDGGQLQELATAHGLLTIERRHEFCGDGDTISCQCAECYDERDKAEGFDCYHVHPLLCGKKTR